MPHGLCKVWKPCDDKKKMLRSCHRNWIMEKSNGWNFRGVQCHSEPMLSYCAGSWIQIMVLPRTGEKGNRNLFSLTCMAFMRIRWGKAHTWERLANANTSSACLSPTPQHSPQHPFPVLRLLDLTDPRKDEGSSLRQPLGVIPVVPAALL